MTQYLVSPEEKTLDERSVEAIIESLGGIEIIGKHRIPITIGHEFSKIELKTPIKTGFGDCKLYIAPKNPLADIDELNSFLDQTRTFINKKSQQRVNYFENQGVNVIFGNVCITARAGYLTIPSESLFLPEDPLNIISETQNNSELAIAVNTTTSIYFYPSKSIAQAIMNAYINYEQIIVGKGEDLKMKKGYDRKELAKYDPRFKLSLVERAKIFFD